MCNVPKAWNGSFTIRLVHLKRWRKILYCMPNPPKGVEKDPLPYTQCRKILYPPHPPGVQPTSPTWNGERFFTICTIHLTKWRKIFYHVPNQPLGVEKDPFPYGQCRKILYQMTSRESFFIICPIQLNQ